MTARSRRPPFNQPYQSYGAHRVPGQNAAILQNFPLASNPPRGPLIPGNPSVLPYRSQVPPMHSLFSMPPQPTPTQLPMHNQQRAHHPAATFPMSQAQFQPIPPGMYPPNMPPHSLGAQNPTQIIPSAPPYSSVPKGVNPSGYQQQYHPSSSQLKRESKAVKIVNPDTKKEVNLDTKPTGESSSTTTQSIPSNKNNVAAEFQSKVQGVLNPEASSFEFPQRNRPNAIISNPSTRTAGVNGGPVATTAINIVNESSDTTTGIKPSLGQNTPTTNVSATVDPNLKPSSNFSAQLPSTTDSVKLGTIEKPNLPESVVSAVPEQPLEEESAKKNDTNVSVESVVKGKSETSSVAPVDEGKSKNDSPTVSSAAVDNPSVQSVPPPTLKKADEKPSTKSEVVNPPKETVLPPSSTNDKKPQESVAAKVVPSSNSKTKDKQPLLQKPQTTAANTSVSMTSTTELIRDAPVQAGGIGTTTANTTTASTGGVVGGGATTTPAVGPEKKQSSKVTEQERPRSARGQDDRHGSKKDQDRPKSAEETKKKEEHKPTVEKKSSLLGEPVFQSGSKFGPPKKPDYELEEGEIPPNEGGDEVIMNGDSKNISQAPGGKILMAVPGTDSSSTEHEQFKYDRNFLLEYRPLALEPPESLRNMHEVFCPFNQTMNHGRRYQQQKKRVIDYKPHAHEKVDLHKAEHRWVRPSNQNIPESQKEAQELFRKFQGILNKLTPQKFSDLATKALSLEIDSEEKLHGCIDRIFEKALEEPNFSIAYANLCRVMSVIKVNVTKVDEEGNDVVVKETSFRRELLTKCQKEFEKDKKDDDIKQERLKAIEEASTDEEKKKKQEELDEWETAARRRSLGNIRFIGELFKLKMLSEGIMHDCILRLLRSTSDHESLECFCRLITTTGKELDHPQAKVRLDRYFERISEIIEKKKISSRIKFMLQDVQDLRKGDWVPRRQEGLKTIDQIHHEAKIEALQEQEMIKNMAAVTAVKSYNRDEKKKSGKDTRQDEGSRKRSAGDVNKILSLRKKDGGSGPTSFTPGGGGLRPGGGGWNKRKDGQTPPPPQGDKDRTSSSSRSVPQKASSSGNSSKRQPTQTTSGRGVNFPGPRRSSTQPNEKQSVLDALSQIKNQGQSSKKTAPAAAAVDKLDEETFRRKTCTIVDEFTENKDYQEAVVCVTELESPGLLNIFVSESILHTLEKSSNHREYAGILLEYLNSKSILAKDKLVAGLKEVIEMVDDLEVDIPKLWDFFGEILAPLFLKNCLLLTDYHGLLDGAGIEYKAPKAVSRLLQQCAVKGPKGAASSLWTKSQLTWKNIGLEDDEKEFLEREKLQFLSSSSSQQDNNPLSSFEDPPYFRDLVVMFGRQDVPSDEILEWIKAQKFEKDSLFIRSLSRASIETSTQGEGDNCILFEEKFKFRLPIVKKWVDENEEFQLQVLNAVQVCMEKLKHPPNLLSTIFWSLYDVEVVSEIACNLWRDQAKEMAGRGMVLQTSKRFFDWLDSADPESDTEVTS